MTEEECKCSERYGEGTVYTLDCPLHNSAAQIPKFALVPQGTKRVKGRVLQYDGNGYFTVLIRGDRRVYMHRDRLIFTNK